MKLKSHPYLCKAVAAEWKRATVKVNSDGLFSIVIPREVRRLMESDHCTEVAGKTLAEAVKAFDDLIDETDNAQITTRRVIAYRFEATLVVEGETGSYGDRLLDRDDIAFQTGAAIAFACNVLDVLKIEGSDGKTWFRYEDVYDKDNHPFPESFRQAHCSSSSFSVDGDPDRDFGNSDSKIIPWSQKKENFFATSCKSFCDLALRLDGVFSGDPKKLETKIQKQISDGVG